MESARMMQRFDQPSRIAATQAIPTAISQLRTQGEGLGK
jgi:hypothetical protein